MTKAEFKRAMQCGLGRCYTELESTENIERYREIVLWGCLHNISFDVQFEGTRAPYLYELLRMFRDDEYFAEPLAKAFLKTKSDGGWHFNHYADLLRCFASDGNKTACAALCEKYDSLYNKLLKSRGGADFGFAKENFETLCINIIILGGGNKFFEIAVDIGRLLSKGESFERYDFEWFYSEAKDLFEKKALSETLKKKSMTSPETEKFYAVMEASEPVKERRKFTTPTAEELIKNRAVKLGERIRFVHRASDEQKKKLAEAIICENDLSVKAEWLSVFEKTSFPLDCEPLVEYTESNCEKLKETAFCALELCESEAVREFALRLLSKGERTDNALCMLITNYRKCDKTAILNGLYGLAVTYSDESYWHGVALHIIRMFSEGKKLPRELLNYIYENSLCSCCRESAVVYMGKRRWLTDEIINECRYDSNGYIREYACKKGSRS